MHVCIDDASRIAVTGIYPNEKALSAIAALRSAVACYHKPGIRASRRKVGAGFRQKRRDNKEIEHRAEKWEPVFGKSEATTRKWSKSDDSYHRYFALR